jgi:cell division protein FtsB
MARRIDLNRRLQKIYGPLAAICIAVYFLYHTIQGERGILSWMRLRGKIQESQQELTILQEQREALDHRVTLLRPNSLDPDMLEEQARKVLNFGRKDEVVVPNEELEKLE